MTLQNFLVKDASGNSVNIGLDQLGSFLRQAVALPRAGTATPTNLGSSVASQQLLVANVDRLGLLIWNDSTAKLYVKYGTTASLTSWTVRIGPDEYWEMPGPIYTGRVDVIWDVANGNARHTELTS